MPIEAELVHLQKLAALGILTAGIIHEFNNRMNHIALTLDSILDRHGMEKDPETGALLREAREQVEHAAGTARNILDFTRSNSQPSAPVHPEKFLNTALRMVEQERKRNGVKTDTMIPRRSPPIRGDERSLEQVFVNLFLNAVQAMPEGGTLRVRVTPSDERNVRIDVEDTGPGIREEVRKRIFEPFFTTKEAGEGTGLGLFVSRRIVETHGGKITVDSRPGEGAMFSVFLPLAVEDADPGKRTTGKHPK